MQSRFPNSVLDHSCALRFKKIGIAGWALLWAGEKELALQQLQARVRGPVEGNMLSYGALKLLPFWDPLRGDPRFEKIVEEAKKPIALE
jgi:hypothetical protein